jgi:MATE family multidrug resistance protein
LIFSNIASTLMMFTDRVFLSRYSITSIAASLPSGTMFFLLQSVFFGLVTYSGIFAAQYVGAGKPRRAAAALWQGLYFSLAVGVLLYSLFFVSEQIFQIAKHSPELIEEETLYFNTLLVAVPLGLSMATMSSFLSSLGRTRLVMWLTFASTGLNVPLDYLLIFGFDWGFLKLEPQGIFGAALATDISWGIGTLLFAYFCFKDSMEKEYGTRSMRQLDLPLMGRLIKYGYPSGMQLFLEVFAFVFFALAIGKLDAITLAANSMALSIESLTFFPMMGMAQAISIKVGHAIGKERPEDGQKAAISGIVLSSMYVFIMLMCFTLFPRFFLGIFTPEDLDPATLEAIYRIGSIMLRFVVLYSFFDGVYVCCFGVLRGAGDVYFPMFAMGFWGVVGVVIPISIFFIMDIANIYTMWFSLVFYVMALTVTFAWRFWSKKWMTKRVIERFDTMD